jgi:predicted DsbA family dithiol-disulfide isomerase
MNVEVWADIVCPWCYIGKRHLDAALDLFAYRDQVAVVWRSYELDPSVSKDDDRAVVDVLVEKYGTSVEEILVSQARVSALGAQAGIEFALEKTRNVNSFDAHRIVQFSAKFGVQSQMVERLYAAHFHEGLRVDDHGVLARCVEQVGIPADEATDILASGAFADDVRIAENTAKELGVRGVPFFVVDRKYAVSGAQAPDVLLDVLNEAWASQSTES